MLDVPRVPRDSAFLVVLERRRERTYMHTHTHTHACMHAHIHTHTNIVELRFRWPNYEPLISPKPAREKEKAPPHSLQSTHLFVWPFGTHRHTYTQIRQLNSTVYIRYCICMYLYLLFVTMLLAPEHSGRRRRWSGVPGHFTGIPLARIQTSCIRREEQLKHNEHWLSKH
jgi:hypothetical protein